MPGVVEVRVLGPLEVEHEGVARLVTGAKARGLLSLLATRPNEPTPPEVLIDELWQGTPPATAASALRVHISHVREALEPIRTNGQSTRLPLERAGYVLRLGVEELDASHFELLVLQGREASMQGDVLAAEKLLARALDHWRGPPLAEIRSLNAAQGPIARLEQLRLGALEELGEVRLALGQHGEIVDALLQAVRDFPLAERLTAQLMLALYRCGRQAEALRAFSSLARRLDDELAAQPSAELRRLEEDILLQRDRINFVGLSRPEPATVTSLSPSEFAGRRAERDRLLAIYAAAADGARRLALVSGPAGIGKTALSFECAKHAAARGATVFVAYCGADPDAQSPIAQIVESALAFVDTETRADAYSALELLSASPSSAVQPAPASEDYPSDQVRLLDVVARMIASIPGCPMVVVEDAQWADDSTLLVLRQLLRHPELKRLFVVVTYRNEAVDERRRTAITRLAPRDCTDAVPLAGLTHHEVRSLVRKIMGPQVVPDFLGVAVTLRDATDGNPFHLRALLDELELSAVASIEQADLEQMIASLAPLGVRDLVAERVTRLSEQALRVTRAAAAVAREISPELIAEVCDLDADAVFDSIDEATGLGLTVEDLRDVTRFEFAHALVRNAIYFGTPDDERHRIHRRVAETMEAHNALAPHAHSQSELAKHFNAALPDGDLGKARYYAERAGRDAAAQLAFAESVRWYEYAIACSDKLGGAAVERGRLELALALAHLGRRQPEPAREAFLRAASHARAGHDAALLADIALAANIGWTSAFGNEAWKVTLLREALSELDATDSSLRMRLLGRLATRLFHSDPDESNSCAQAALAISQSLDDPAARAEALLGQRLAVSRRPADCQERLRLTQTASQLVGSSTSAAAQRVRRELLSDLLSCAELERFETELDRYERDAHELASPRDLYWAMTLRATEATLHGDLEAGEQLARGAAVRGFELEPTVAGAEYLQRFAIRFQQGRLSEVVSPPEVPDTPASEAGDADPQGAYRAGAALAALAHAETGHVERAARTAHWAIGPDGNGIRRDSFWLAAHALLAVVAVAADDRELAALLDDLIAPCANQLVTFGAAAAVFGCGHHWLGLLAQVQGMPDRAVEHLSAAADLSTRVRAPFWLAQAQLDLAGVLYARGRANDRKRADALSTEATHAAQLGGFDRILTRASGLNSG